MWGAEMRAEGRWRGQQEPRRAGSSWPRGVAELGFESCQGLRDLGAAPWWGFCLHVS